MSPHGLYMHNNWFTGMCSYSGIKLNFVLFLKKLLECCKAGKVDEVKNLIDSKDVDPNITDGNPRVSALMYFLQTYSKHITILNGKFN